jgi:hypothetical protein
LYSDKERTQPVYDEYKREFVRKLTIVIPEGYHVKNLKDLNVKVEYVKDGKSICKFESTYKIEGNKIEVDVLEYYDQIGFEVEEYESYRAVVNSASDFNKVVLVIQKNE